jgi:hypothetical protein
MTVKANQAAIAETVPAGHKTNDTRLTALMDAADYVGFLEGGGS